MAVPYFINDDRSEMRGIKPGWYAIDDDGHLSSGPFSSREECHSLLNVVLTEKPKIKAESASRPR